jgi:hypothetical protein
MKVSKADQRLLAFWAAHCAEHVLSIFEATCPDDDRPRRAIEAARAWARGEIRCGSSARKGGWGARATALASHDAARAVPKEFPEAIAAARAAGHAAAVAHSAGHAKGAALYALKAAARPKTEHSRQLRWLPKRLHSVVGEYSSFLPMARSRRRPKAARSSAPRNRRVC